MSEWYCLIDGRQVGPVSQQQVQKWLDDGRMKPADYVWRDGMEQWARVGDLMEFDSPIELADEPPEPPRRGGPTVAPGYTGYGPAPGVEPHRGTLILIFGILGLIFCFLFGVAAWVMGDRDLALMRKGQMDRSGYDLTNAGRILGIIVTVLVLVGVGIMMFVMCAGALATI